MEEIVIVPRGRLRSAVLPDVGDMLEQARQASFSSLRYDSGFRDIVAVFASA